MSASSKKKRRDLTAHEVRQIAVTSQTDPRTVKRVLAGEPTRGMPRDRVLAALREAGLA